MYFFCFAPITCCHLLNPAALVTSSKTTVPLSTNPPAVMGRFCASYTGAKVPADEMPPIPPCCSVFAGFCFCFGVACCAAPSMRGAKTASAITPRTPTRQSLRMMLFLRGASCGSVGRLSIGTRFTAAERAGDPLALFDGVDTIHCRQFYLLHRAGRPVNLSCTCIGRIAKHEVQPAIVGRDVASA